MTTEELKIRITADTVGVESSVNRVKQSLNGISGKKAQEAGNAVSASMESVRESIDKLRNMTALDMLTDNLEGLAKVGNGISGIFQDATTNIKYAFQSLSPSSYFQGEWKGWSQAFKDFGKNIRQVGRDAKSNLKNAGDAFTELFHNIIPKGAGKAVAAIGAVIAVIGTLTAAIKGAVSASQRIRTDYFDSKKVGLSTAAYQEWSYVLGQVGVEADALSDFIKSLSAAQNDLRDGSEAMTEAFQQLGFNIDEVVNMSQEDLFVETIRRLQQMESQVQKTGIAYRIFGEDDASKVANILALNNQEMERMINNFYLLGGGASDAAIQKSLMLSGSVSNMRLAWQGLAQTIGEVVMPVLTKIVNAITIAIAAVNMFLRALFGLEIVVKGSGGSGINKAASSVGGYTDAVKDATAAAKELKRTTMGFDELNIVSDPNKDAGGGAGSDIGSIGGGGSIDIPDMNLEGLTQDLGLEKMAAWFEKNAEAIRKWTGVVVGATTAWGLLKTAILLLTGQKITFFGTLGTAISKVIALFKGIGAGTTVAAAALVAIASVIYTVIKHWEDLTVVVKKFVATDITPRLQGIKDAFSNLWDALGALGNSLLDILGPIGEAIADFVEMVGGPFEALGVLLTSILGGVLGGTINAVLDLITYAVNIITNIIQAITGFVDAIVSLFTGDLEGVVEASNRIWIGVTNAFNNLIDGTIGVVIGWVMDVIKWFTELWDVLVGHSIVPDMVNAIIDWFKKLPKQIIKLLADFVKKVINHFKDLAKKAEKTVKDLWTTITKVWDKIKDDTVKVWESIKKALSSVFDKIKSTATTVFNAIVKFFDTTWDKIKNAATTAWNAISKFFTDTWNKIKTTATTIFNAVMKFFSDTWNSIKNTTTTVWNTIKSTLDTIWNSIKNTATTIWNAIKAFFDTTWNAIKNAATTAWNAIKTLLETTWNSIKTTATTIWTAIKQLFIDTWENIKTSATNAWNNIKTMLDNTWNAIKTAASTLCDNLKNFFINAWNAIKSTWDTVKGYFQDIWNAIKNAASSMLDSVKGFFSSAWTSIKNTWSGVSSWFGDVWSGIKGKFSDVVSYFGDKFGSAVSTIKQKWSDIKDWFQEKWNSVKNVFTTAGQSIGSSITTALKNSFNNFMSNAVGKINGFIRAINSAIGLINKIPGVNIGTLRELSVPQLAKGGIVTGSILANIGERGKEAVLPLENNTSWMDILADRIAARSGPTRVVLQVDGRELGWATIENINSITKQTGGLQLTLV